MSNQKAGLDYFSLYVDIEQDDKIALIQAKYGLEGFAAIIKLFIKIYADKGYYYEWNDKTSLLFAGRLNMEHSKINQIVFDAIEWELFNKEKFQKYQILTSKRIQKMYLEATKRRKKVDILKPFLLLNGEDVDILNENVNIIDENVYILEQSKVKESKVNKSKVNNNIYTTLNDKNNLEQIEHTYSIDSVSIIIAYLNEKANTNYKPTTKKTQNLIKARFNEGFTLNDFKTVIDKKIKSWADTEWEKYIRPETLFGTKFESYLNEKITGKGGTNANNRGSIKRFENEREYTDEEQRRIEEKFYA